MVKLRYRVRGAFHSKSWFNGARASVCRRSSKAYYFNLFTYQLLGNQTVDLQPGLKPALSPRTSLAHDIGLPLGPVSATGSFRDPDGHVWEIVWNPQRVVPNEQ